MIFDFDFLFGYEFH